MSVIQAFVSSNPVLDLLERSISSASRQNFSTGIVCSVGTFLRTGTCLPCLVPFSMEKISFLDLKKDIFEHKKYVYTSHLGRKKLLKNEHRVSSGF